VILETVRAVWVAAILVLATLFFGLVAILGALFRVRGRLYFWATQSWSRTILRATGVRVVTHGLEEVPWDAPQVLVCNHVSIYDVFALAAVLPNPFSFVGKKELDSIPFFGMAWKAAGHISIDRSDRQKAIASLRRAGEKLRREHGTVILFPEGTRSPDGALLPFKKGAFTLALEARVPVVPAVIHGSERVAGPGFRIRPHPIHIHFGVPVETELHVGSGTEGLLLAVRERMAAMVEAARLPEPVTRAPPVSS
jgi:1-acyl-sn-glycerol-3-phosphate acyltransferase